MKCVHTKAGELRVKKSGLCVDIGGKNGKGKVETWDCDGGPDQILLYCEDHTIRPENNDLYCLQTEQDNGNGDVKS